MNFLGKQINEEESDYRAWPISMKSPESVNLTREEKAALLESVSSSNMGDGDKAVLSKVLKAYCWIQQGLMEAKISLHRIRTFFGIRTTEKRSKLPEGDKGGFSRKSPQVLEKPKNHGRLGHKDYWGAKEIHQPHETLKRGDKCPEGCGGHLGSFKDRIVIALKGESLVSGFKYFLQSLRCNSCQRVFSATPPRKYDASVKAIIAIAKSYLGIPFNRLAMAQSMVGIHPMGRSGAF